MHAHTHALETRNQALPYTMRRHMHAHAFPGHTRFSSRASRLGSQQGDAPCDEVLPGRVGGQVSKVARKLGRQCCASAVYANPDTRAHMYDAQAM
eukprot:15435557-Alexandrium_andersonii.AAC.1